MVQSSGRIRVQAFLLTFDNMWAGGLLPTLILWTLTRRRMHHGEGF
jgi:hypothetical protein